MGTRSVIGVIRPNGMSVGAVYCHSDGDIPWVGKTLFLHWGDLAKAQQLFEHGGMSVLGREIGRKFKLFAEPTPPGQCAFYHRDRGDPIGDARISYRSIGGFKRGFDAQHIDSAFAYLHNGKEWVSTGDGDHEWRSLSQRLLEEGCITTADIPGYITARERVRTRQPRAIQL